MAMEWFEQTQKIGLIFAVCCSCLFSFVVNSQADPIIIDHNSTDITQIPQVEIERAKTDLHIAYGHTSHGSQLTTGMTGLVAFANGGGLGLSLPTDIFSWNNGGDDGALDLHDYAMGGDVGYYPAWVNNTKAYLNSHADVNVIIWSWCGQVDSKYSDGFLGSEYLEPMTQLEEDYPNVKFVYMTGHVDIWDDADNKAANQMIRDYCEENDKILYDFADIERYDPDGTYYEFVNDNCDYYSGPGVRLLGNWALEWQGSHIQNVDWYSCSSAHSQALNANRKAYAAWWLWARLAGWDGGAGPVCNNDGVCDSGESYSTCPNDCVLPCSEDWICNEWSEWGVCTIKGQSRTRTCVDQSGCETEINKPLETDTKTCSLDITPPIRSNGQPAGKCPNGTKMIDITLQTDEKAICRYSKNKGTLYGNMVPFSNPEHLSQQHKTTVKGLVDGGAYSFYLRCIDERSNENSDDLTIKFFVGHSYKNGNILKLYMQGILPATSE